MFIPCMDVTNKNFSFITSGNFFGVYLRLSEQVENWLNERNIQYEIKNCYLSHDTKIDVANSIQQGLVGVVFKNNTDAVLFKLRWT